MHSVLSVGQMTNEMFTLLGRLFNSVANSSMETGAVASSQSSGLYDLIILSTCAVVNDEHISTMFVTSAFDLRDCNNEDTCVSGVSGCVVSLL